MVLAVPSLTVVLVVSIVVFSAKMSPVTLIVALPLRSELVSRSISATRALSDDPELYVIVLPYSELAVGTTRTTPDLSIILNSALALALRSVVLSNVTSTLVSDPSSRYSVAPVMTVSLTAVSVDVDSPIPIIFSLSP